MTLREFLNEKHIHIQVFVGDQWQLEFHPNFWAKGKETKMAEAYSLTRIDEEQMELGNLSYEEITGLVDNIKRVFRNLELEVEEQDYAKRKKKKKMPENGQKT